MEHGSGLARVDLSERGENEREKDGDLIQMNLKTSGRAHPCHVVWLYQVCRKLVRALFTSQKILQNFSHSPLHRIFRRMHGVLNIDENKN